jgi:hypothetical protein
MAQNWTLLVDQFYSAANALIAKENLNVAFILDGVGTPGGGRTCLNNMWTDWCSPADSRNCTYIPPTDPIEASFSNNPEFGFERFQVLNPFLWPLVDWFASKDYYKFGQQSEYPVLYWEPSTQRNIQQVRFCHS